MRRLLAFACVAGIAGACAVIVARRASSSEPPLEPELRAAYPASPAPTGSLAGVDLAKLAFPGLSIVSREVHASDDGGLVLSFADGSNDVRVVVTLAVAPDAAGARRFVDVELHGVATILAPAPSFGDRAFADAGGKGDAIVVAAIANVAYSVRALEGASLRAGDVARAIFAAAVPGAPVFPTTSVSIPPVVAKEGADVRVVAPNGTTPKLRAEGAYVAHAKSGPRVKPFGPGPIAVVATVVDDLGRVAEARAEAVAK